jgi:carboxylesterase
MPGAEPFAFDGSGDVGVLLVHGFTGSPYEVRPVGEYLAALGIGSVGVRLRGHGTHPNDMLGCTHRDWLADAEAGLEELLARYRRVFMIGMSMGGTIVLNLAARRANDPRIAGVVSLCAPVRLLDWRLGFAGILSRLIRWQAWGRPDIKDQSAWDSHVAYRRFRSRTILPLLSLLRETVDLLVDVRQPLLVVQARHDNVVPPSNAQLIFDGVSSAEKRVLWLDDCYHVVTVDFEAPIVNAAIARFIAARSASTPTLDPTPQLDPA